MDDDAAFWAAVAASSQDVSSQQKAASQQKTSHPVTTSEPHVGEDEDDDAFWAEVASSSQDVVAKTLPASVVLRVPLPLGLTYGLEFDAILQTDLLPGELLKIVAAAGAGKSTILREYSRQRPEMKILYLTYNRDVANDKKREFELHRLHNVTVQTTHALALAHTKDHHNGKPAADCFLTRGLLQETMTPIEPREGDWSYGHVHAVKETLVRFCASTDPFVAAAHVPDKLADKVHARDVLRASQEVWRLAADPQDDKLRVWHEAYLKLFQIDKSRRDAALDVWDLLLLDEAHDCTEAQVDLFTGAPRARKIVVFDPHQAIYGFRYARGVAAVGAVDAVATLPLSQSWRFGDSLAAAAARILNVAKQRTLGAPVRICGAPGLSTRLVARSQPPFELCTEGGRQLVILARTNRTLLEAASQACKHGLSLHFPGGESVFKFVEDGDGADRLKDVHRLCRGQPLRGNNKGSGFFLHKFAAREYKGGWEGYKQFMEKLHDVKMRMICELVEEHVDDLPEMVDAIERRTVSHQAQAHVLFSSTHKAKGLGWPIVYLCADFLADGRTPGEAVDEVHRRCLERNRSLPCALDLLNDWCTLLARLDKDAEEEVNCLYVAATRAMETLYVHDVVAEWCALAGIRLEGRAVPGAEADEEADEEADADAANAVAGASAVHAAANAAAGASSSVAAGDADDDGEVSYVGRRTVEERNAMGFASAIDLDATSGNEGESEGERRQESRVAGAADHGSVKRDDGEHEGLAMAMMSAGKRRADEAKPVAEAEGGVLTRSRSSDPAERKHKVPRVQHAWI